jgi:hypothetical protein
MIFRGNDEAALFCDLIGNANESWLNASPPMDIAGSVFPAATGGHRFDKPFAVQSEILVC